MQRYENCKPKFVKEFIELYKSFPCLWHQQSKQYEHQKQKAYEALVQKCREVDPLASMETVKRKINALRTSDSDDSDGSEVRIDDESWSRSSRLPSQPLGTLTNDDLEEIFRQKLDVILQNDPTNVHGTHVAHKLRSFGEQQNNFTQKLINDIMYDGKFNQKLKATNSTC
uniref:MADF domain-containing protein n=1 Tax=Anopheles culicifacies TaxID=139723 RepID=A0A182MSG9_9DIPT